MTDANKMLELAERLLSIKYRPEVFGDDDKIGGPGFTSGERDLIASILRDVAAGTALVPRAYAILYKYGGAIWKLLEDKRSVDYWISQGYPVEPLFTFIVSPLPSAKSTPSWICCHCDAPLSCDACGVEQPDDSTT